MINFFEWPPKGADLNPIELCFGEIQRQAKENYSNVKKIKMIYGIMRKISSLRNILKS